MATTMLVLRTLTLSLATREKPWIGSDIGQTRFDIAVYPQRASFSVPQPEAA